MRAACARHARLSSACPHASALLAGALRNRHNISFLAARNGSDHLLVVPHNGYWFDQRPVYELNVRDKRLGAAVRFALEHGSKYEWRAAATRTLRAAPPCPARGCSSLRTGGRRRPGATTLSYFKSTPFPSYVHAELSMPWAELPWRQRPRRQVLIAAAFNAKHGATSNAAVRQMNAQRAALIKSCKADGAAGFCSFLSLSPGALEKGGFHFRLSYSVVRQYWNATFCLQPVGDACTRKGQLDALLLGCIPVLLHPCQEHQWPWHWGSWFRNATVALDPKKVASGELDVVRELRAVPTAQARARCRAATPHPRPLRRADATRRHHATHLQVRAMQRVIAEHAHCMHYVHATPPNGSQPAAVPGMAHLGGVADAFEISMQGVLALQRGEAPDRNGLVAPAGARLCQRVPLPRDAPGWERYY